MAGTGNLQVMRLIRFLRKRGVGVNQITGAESSYGSHVAIHMALGFLFIGAGRSLQKHNSYLKKSYLCG